MDIGTIIVTVKQRGLPGQGNCIPVGAYGVLTNTTEEDYRVSLDLKPLKVRRSEREIEMLRADGMKAPEFISHISVNLPKDYVEAAQADIEFDAEFEKFIWTWNNLVRDAKTFDFKYEEE